MNAEEVELLAREAARHSVSLVALGAGTAPESGAGKQGIAVRFDLMRRTRLPDGEEPWVEAEPGVPWLQLDDELRVRGMGLAVYPTSAPRATVGGWLATDGLGVGSFEYGWLSENVLWARVVLPGGERREVAGEELRSLIGSGGGSGIVVGARLRTRLAGSDVPFAAVLDDADDLAASVADLTRSGVPLWHLAFVNPVMARARRLDEDYLLFGLTRKSGPTRSKRAFGIPSRPIAVAFSPTLRATACGERDSSPWRHPTRPLARWCAS